MKKMYVNIEDLNDEEKRTGRVSYSRIVKRFIGDLVLCNDIVNIDQSVDLNVNRNFNYNDDIFQYYLCNIGDYEKEQLEEYGIILSYSNRLELDVLLVDHWGTSWDYVMTDVEWTENLDEVLK